MVLKLYSRIWGWKVWAQILRRSSKGRRGKRVNVLIAPEISVCESVADGIVKLVLILMMKVGVSSLGVSVLRFAGA